MSERSGVKNSLYSFIIFIASAQVIYFFYFATNLRPIADDYCIAAISEPGLRSAFVYWFTNWTGDAIPILLNHFLIGAPLINIPYTFASVITLFVAVVLVTVLITFITNSKIRISTILIFFPVISLSFLGYWSASNFFAVNNEFKYLNNMILHWQNINSAYIIASTLMLLVLIFILRIKTRNKYIWVLLFLMGVLAGTSGIVLVLSILSLFFYFIIKYFITKELFLLFKFMFFSFGLIVGLTITYFSPGAQARSSILGSSEVLSNFDLLALISWTFPEALIEWINGIWHLGSILVFIFGFLTNKILNRSKNYFTAPDLHELLTLTIFLSISSAVLSQLSEAFSYQAFWHLATPYFFLFVSIFIAGYLVAKRLEGYLQSFEKTLIPILTGLVLGLSYFTVTTAVTEINERKERWQVGPAPVSGISDIENKEDWVFSCWMQMKKYKGYPDRENF